MIIWKIYFYIILAVTIICSIVGKSLLGGILITIGAIAYTFEVPLFIWAAKEVYKALKNK